MPGKFFIKKICFLILSFCCFKSFSLDLTDISTSLSDAFYKYTCDNEGNTSFRSLLIPCGGRAESLGSAFTGLADDTAYFDYNPAGSALIDQTQLSIYHNSWIADSAMETLCGTIRFENLGMGFKFGCFYVPFSEYDSFGSKVTASYYSETQGVLNLAYNFLAGYTFKGIAVGTNFKACWRSIPDYCDDETGDIIENSGLNESALGIMGDIGLLFQFNFWKFYTSRKPNIKVGFSALNIGTAITGFKSENGVTQDDGLPTILATGVSYKPLKPLTFTADFKQPINFKALDEPLLFLISSGVEVTITDFFSILSGFELKGANPRISFGAEAELYKFRVNLNYTLDLTTSVNPVNHISLSGKILLGDRGRKEKQNKIDALYNEGIMYFSERNYEKAIEIWKEALKLDKYFDPASRGIKSAEYYMHMLEEYNF